MTQKSMVVTVEEEGDGNIRSFSVNMKYVPLVAGTNIIRVILQSQFMRHSTVLFLDNGRNKGWWWNPLTISDNSKRSLRLHAVIRTLIADFVSQRVGDSFELFDISQRVQDTSSSKCKQSGLCNALVLRYIVDWFNGDDFDPSDIQSFAKRVSEKYSSMLTKGQPDIEYNFSPGGAMLGGLAGLTIGGAVGGSGGALMGGTLGALGGGGAFSKSEQIRRNTDFNEESEERADYDGSLSDLYSKHYSERSTRGYNVRDYSRSDAL